MHRFVRLGWITVALNVGVILWGAWVRATGSGAGCGSHWPLCNGEVVPRAPEAATVVEFVHRVTSGLALIAVVVLLVSAWRAYPRGHVVRRTSAAAVGFIVLEAALGAGLVLFGLVAGDTSGARAVVGALHLANTYLLLAALTLTAVFGGQMQSPRWRGERSGVALGLVSLGCLLAVGMTGAVTALGDTLFRPATLAAGFAQELAPASHPLVRMRLIHPLAAVLACLLTAYYGSLLIEPGVGSAPARGVFVLWTLLALQLAAGAVNVLLLAPLGLQILHLLLSDLIWILVVALSAKHLTEQL